MLPDLGPYYLAEGFQIVKGAQNVRIIGRRPIIEFRATKALVYDEHLPSSFGCLVLRNAAHLNVWGPDAWDDSPVDVNFGPDLH